MSGFEDTVPRSPADLLGVAAPITTCDPASYGHVGLPIDGRCSMCGAEWQVVDEGGVGIETKVVGGPPAPGPCEHPQVNQQVMYATVNEYRPVGQVKVKIKCAVCGVPFRFRFDTARASEADGDLGLVVDVEPVGLPEPWQPAGEG